MSGAESETATRLEGIATKGPCSRRIGGLASETATRLEGIATA